jgi:ParB family transcriptional regulator, chromosome partitioning protein
MTIQLIPAANCVLSSRNVRRSAASDKSLEELKADIAARGVLQNLIGFAIPKKKGKFEITAGGRRLRAVHGLIERGDLGADYQIPVFVMNDTSAAAETSLAENFQRQAMNPADECTAFRYFIESEGKTAEDVAKRFGLTTRFVEGRVRLAGLANEVFEALQKGEISLEVAQAFGTTSDVPRQSAVYAQYKGGYYGFTVANVRRAMTDETITGNHALAKLVGRDTYIDAGGRIERDLFAAGLVRTLAEAKMAEAATAVTGYANVVPVLSVRPAYDLTRELRPVHGTPIEPSAEEQARLEEIEQQLEAIETEAETTEFTEEEAEEVEGKIEALEAEAAAITNRIGPIDDEVRSKATAFIVIGADGTPSLHETIYVEPTVNAENGRSGGTAGDGSDEEADAPGAPKLGKPLRDELAVQRTKLLGLHLANDPGMAVDLGIFLLADAQARSGYYNDRASSLQGSAPTRAPFGYTPEGTIIDQLQSFTDALDHSWAEHKDICDRFNAFKALDEGRRGAWAGWVIARTLEPKLADETGSAFHNHLGRSLGIDVAAWWRPR